MFELLAMHASFISQKSRHKKDLGERIQRIVNFASKFFKQTAGAVVEAQILEHLLGQCRSLINIQRKPTPSTETKRDFLVHIARN